MGKRNLVTICIFVAVAIIAVVFLLNFYFLQAGYSKDYEHDIFTKLEDYQPAGIILGTSRGAAFPENHTQYPEAGKPWINLSVPSSNVHQTFLRLKHVVCVSTVREVIWSIDFLQFNAYNIGYPGFDETFYLESCPENAHLRNLVVLFKKLQRNLYQNLSIGRFYEVVRAYLIAQTNRHFLLKVAPPDLNRIDSSRGRFIINERSYLEGGNYFDRSYRKFEFKQPETKKSTLDQYRDLLEYLYSSNINLRIAITPVHARQLEVIEAANLWGKFEDWKRSLVTLNSEVAKKYGRRPYTVLDAATYNVVSMADAIEPKNNDPIFFKESSHFSEDLVDRIVSNIIVDRLADDFFTQISPENIDSHLTSVRERRQSYRHTHKVDVADILSSYRRWRDDQAYYFSRVNFPENFYEKLFQAKNNEF